MNAKSNESESNEEILLANYILNVTTKFNVYFSLIVIMIGLCGNFITIFVFSQKKFRKNSSNVYLLALAIIDILFLITHFFEDTIRTYENIVDQKSSNLIQSLRMSNAFGNAVRKEVRFWNQKGQFILFVINYV